MTDELELFHPFDESLKFYYAVNWFPGGYHSYSYLNPPLNFDGGSTEALLKWINENDDIFENDEKEEVVGKMVNDKTYNNMDDILKEAIFYSPNQKLYYHWREEHHHSDYYKYHNEITVHLCCAPIIEAVYACCKK